MFTSNKLENLLASDEIFFLSLSPSVIFLYSMALESIPSVSSVLYEGRSLGLRVGREILWIGMPREVEMGKINMY